MRQTSLALAITLLGSSSLVMPAAAAAANAQTQATSQMREPQAATSQGSGPSSETRDSSHNGGPQNTPMSMAQIRTRIQNDRAAFFEARLAALHAGLQLEGNQDGLWAPVETAIRDFAKLHRPHDDKAEAKDNSDDDGDDHAGIDRLRARSEHLIGKGQAMKKLVEATEPLIDGLSAAQKDRLPILLEGLQPRRILHAAFGLDDETASRSAARFDGGPQFDGGGYGARGSDSGFGRMSGGEPGPGARFEQRFQQFPGGRGDGADAGGGLARPWSLAGGGGNGGQTSSRDDED